MTSTRLRVGVATAAILALARLILHPRVDAASPAEAVVALDGDRPRRLRTAIALAVAGYAPVVVAVRADNAAPELLRRHSSLPFEVVSFIPDPPTTRGEARGLAVLAAERGWSQLLVVTSTFHVLRARLILRRAVDSNMSFVAAGMDRRRAPVYLVSEAAKLVLALTLRRSP